MSDKAKRPLRYRGFRNRSSERPRPQPEALRAPDPARTIVAKAFALYRRYTLLFLVLALCVTLPYDLLILILTGSGPLAENSDFILTYPLLAFLVSPLISALHIHAVADINAGRTPRLRNVAARGLRVLPTCAAAAIMTTLGISLGLVMLILPGILLSFRWYVAVQAAAIEHDGWLPAMRRSRELTKGVYGHLLAFVVLVAIVGSTPIIIGKAIATGHDTLVIPFIGGTLLDAFSLAFAALATAMLYFDLTARHSVAPSHAGDDGGEYAHVPAEGP